MANAQAQHTEHILPLRVYFAVFAALLVLTAITVWIAGFHFGPFNLVVAMAVAAVKASLVALFFMHLKYDNKLYLTIFITSIAFLAIFIVLTMFDTLTRGKIDEQKMNPINPNAVIYEQSEMSLGSDTTVTDTTDADTATSDTPGASESDPGSSEGTG